MTRTAFHTRRGFTLVELLVVITIIGILVGLLLPAVNSARESARMAQCANNVRQIGLAVSAHLTEFQVYPGGGDGPGATRTITDNGTYKIPETYAKQAWGWAYQILPYLDNQALWANLDDVAVAKTPIVSYFCPSRRRPVAIAGTNWRSQANPRAMTDYAANGGTVGDGTAGNGWYGVGADGIVAYRKQHEATLPAQIKDGLSNTILAGEKRLNDAFATSDTQADDNDGYVSGYQDDTIRWGPSRTNKWGDLTPHVDMFGPVETYATINPRTWEFGAAHASGAQFVMCDGSMRLIHYNVNGDVFRRACCRDDLKFYPADDPTYDPNAL